MQRRKPDQASPPVSGNRAALLPAPPRTRDELYGWVHRVFGLDVPGVAIAPGSTPPLDYLCHSFFEEPGDAVVWANRGGGKTMLGAAATLLDLIFKPGIQVHVLGGSMEQSRKMHEHMVSLLDRTYGKQRLGDRLLSRPPTRTRIALRNGSAVELLAQSQRSVRGTRVHKLRCDEVDEFDHDIWAAAQMVTRSGRCGRWHVPGTVEAISTMHRPFGLMSRLVSDDPAEPASASDAAPAAPRVFRWSALDVIERCPEARPCDGCVLHDDCGGRAKHASGFIPVDDLVSQFHRTDRATWDAEILCRRPTVSDCVYPGFDPAVHVRRDIEADADATWLAGMDFGVRSPTVWLWAVVFAGPGGAEGAAEHIHIIDEHHRAGGTLDGHLDVIDAQALGAGYPRPAWVGVDPAGRARNGQTGRSDIALLEARGHGVRSCTSAISAGISLVRRRLDRRTLSIHPRCVKLIEAMQAYHFDPDHPHRDQPIKDGPDHAADALRYLLVNLERSTTPVLRGSYL